MELKEIFELVSLGSSLVFPAIGWATKNVVARWRADALIERAKDKEDLKTWIEGRFMASKEADGRIKHLEENHERLEENHKDLLLKVERAEDRIGVIELRWHPRAPRSEPLH